MNRKVLPRSARPGRSSDETPGHIAVELRRYDEHLRGARGLAAKTRDARCRIVGPLLRWKYGEGPSTLLSYVRGFLASQLERNPPHA